MSSLDIGSERLVNVYNGRGGDVWIPATLTSWEEPNFAVFTLSRPDWLGCRNCCIPLPGGRHRLLGLYHDTKDPTNAKS